MIYERCKSHNIPYRRTGKLVVARADQVPYVEDLHRKAMALKWPPHSTDSGHKLVLPTKLLSGSEARILEPDLSDDIAAALWCPETGILDSHSFMGSLEKDIIESEGGHVVYNTRVVRIDPCHLANAAAADGWVVQTVSGGAEEGDAILARTLINAAGLSSTLILNAILPETARIPMYYAKGSYASYNGPGTGKVSHLIYPCPETGKDAHAFHSLGTHLTLDLNGKIRFGPDLEWISSPSSDHSEDADFWQKHLAPDESRLEEMHKAVTRYLPGVVLKGMQPDYSGMRPKLVPPQGGFQDFILRTDYSTDRSKTNPSNEGGTMISLLGIESPGLTSSLGIAEYLVEHILGASR